MTRKDADVKLQLVSYVRILKSREVKKLADVNKLRGKMVEKGISVVELSGKIGIDKTTFYRKINEDGENFTIREAKMIIRELELNKEESIAIFFGQTVS